MPPYAVGIDSGTQGTKALVVDADYRPRPRPGPGPPRHDRRASARARASRTRPSGSRRREEALAAALKTARVDPATGRRAGRLGPAARLRPARRGGPGHPAGQALERHLDHRGDRGDRRPRSAAPRRPSPGSASPRPSASRPRRSSGSKSTSRSSFARLATVLLPHNYLNYWLTGRAAHGIRRRLRHRAHGHPPAALGRGGRGRDRSGPRPASSPPLSHPREPVGLMRSRLAAALRLRPASSSRAAAATT